ncbi:hypothetical protein [Porcipelethomonas sp.]|uniref:hypothetical protein n=1 Tax=Porcipelethomonas sp. TaxID=2981675 RepID=UPI003EF74D2E
MSETVTYLIKFCGMFFIILLLIFLLAVITPKLASRIDRLISKIVKPKPERVDDNIYKVKSIYDMPEKAENYEKNNDENGELKDGKE